MCSKIGLCCQSIFIANDENAKGEKCGKSLATMVALIAIAALIVGGLAMMGIIGLSNPIAIGLMIGGGALFALTTLSLCLSNIKCSKKIADLSPSASDDSGPDSTDSNLVVE